MHYPQTRKSRSAFATILSIVGTALCLSSGCVLRGNVEVLEAQLRQQENLTATYQQQIEDLRAELSTTQRQLEFARSEIAPTQTMQVAFEIQRSLAEVTGIAFNTLLTAAQDLDGTSGDERLHAVLYPHDEDGEIVKIAGELTLEAIDLSLPENERSVGKWNFAAADSKSRWHAGFISSGFLIDEPWDSLPQGKSIILHATFKTVDDRTFTATYSLEIVPPAVIDSNRPHRSVRAVSFQSSSLDSELSAHNSDSSATDDASPLLNGVLTSDRWSDAEIPAYR